MFMLHYVSTHRGVMCIDLWSSVASRSDIPLAIMCSLEDHTAEQMVHLLNADGPVTAHRYTSCDTKGECQRAVVMEMVIFALEGVIVFCGIVLFCVDQLDRIIKTVCSLAFSNCCLVAVMMFAYSTDGTNHKNMNLSFLLPMSRSNPRAVCHCIRWLMWMFVIKINS